jgi:hypothetical protein
VSAGQSGRVAQHIARLREMRAWISHQMLAQISPLTNPVHSGDSRAFVIAHGNLTVSAKSGSQKRSVAVPS